MKKIKLIFLSVVTIAGVGGALATGHRAPKPGSVTYFAVQTTSGYTWVTVHSIPNGYACTPESTTAACTVISADGTRPGDNSHPNTSNYTYSDANSMYVEQ
jgi:hypothetical protein